jgi:hypothetical protein
MGRRTTMIGVRPIAVLSLLTGLIVTGVVVAPEPNAVAAGGSCNTSMAVTAKPDPPLDALFQSYGNAGQGYSWTGGDGTGSVALPDGRELWLFDDSLLGTVTNGSRIFAKSPFLHNSLIVEDHGQLTKTYYTLRTKRPTAYLDPSRRYLYKIAFWPDTAIVNGNTLQILGNKEQFRKDGTYFPLSGTFLETLALPSLKRLGFQQLPTGLGGLGGVLSEGGYTYIYGYFDGAVYVARVVGANLASPWAYYDGSGWTVNFASAVPVEHISMQSHFSVSAVAGAYLFVARSSPFSDQVVGALGCSPVGPFGPTQSIYATPEPAAYPPSYGVVTYGARAHPELSTAPNTLVVSYDVNFAATHGLTNPDSSVYRPRFIDVTVG